MIEQYKSTNPLSNRVDSNGSCIKSSMMNYALQRNMLAASLDRVQKFSLSINFF